MEILIQHHEEKTRGVFFVEAEDEHIAEMRYYHKIHKKIVIDHTEVSNILRGQGVGKMLLMEVVRFARKNDLKIIPGCPFVKDMFIRYPDYRDVA